MNQLEVKESFASTSGRRPGILILNHRDQAHPAAGGAERLLSGLGIELARAGNLVRFLSVGTLRSSSDSKSVENNTRRVRSNILAHLAAPIIEHSLPPDCVVIESLAHVLPWAGPRFTRSRGIALFFHLHNLVLKGSYPSLPLTVVKWIENHYPEFYHDWPFIAISNSGSVALASIGIPRSQITVIEPAVDIHRFTPGKISSRATIVMTSGLRPYKRPEDAIRVCSLVRRSGMRPILRVVGESPQLDRLRELASREQCDVEFMGRLTDEQLIDVLRSAWVNIVPSTGEGWSLSVMEASAVGVPSVGYRVPGLVDSVESGVNGLLVNDGDIDALSQATSSILQDPLAWRERCVIRARQFSWPNTAAKWLEVINRVRAENRRAG